MIDPGWVIIVVDKALLTKLHRKVKKALQVVAAILKDLASK